MISVSISYKALSLGAKAVGVGSHLIPYLKNGGKSAAAERIREMTAELRGFMANTGVKDTQSFDPSILHFYRG